MDEVVEIAGIDAVVMSRVVAGELADGLTLLNQLVNARGARLSPRLLGHRQALARHAGTRVNANTRVELEDLPHGEGALVDTTTAAQRLGMTTDAVRWHCRRGKFARVAIRRGGRWWIPTSDVEAYATTPR